MICHLTHTSDQAEDVGVVVQDNTGGDVGVELAFAITVDTFVQVKFFFVEVVATDSDESGREPQVVGPLDFCTAEHDQL